MMVFQNNQLNLQGSIITIGAFDGIHQGHQALIKQAKSRALSFQVPLVVYTFDPPPRVYFEKQHILTPLPSKLKYLEELGVDFAVIAKFDDHYASRAVKDFIAELKQLNPFEVWVGPNFQFGKGKSGTFSDLASNFNSYMHPFVTCQAGKIISSTRIRQLISQKRIDEVYSLLGREEIVNNI